jgi:hypothetical protein
MFGEPDVTGVDGAASLIDDISDDGGFNFVVAENYLVGHCSILVGINPDALVPRAVVPPTLMPVRTMVVVMMLPFVVLVPAVMMLVMPVVMIGSDGAGDQGCDCCQ